MSKSFETSPVPVAPFKGVKLTSKSFTPPPVKETVKDILKELAKPGCSHCYGRGFTWKHADTGQVIQCRCVAKKLNKRGIERLKEAS